MRDIRRIISGKKVLRDRLEIVEPMRSGMELRLQVLTSTGRTRPGQTIVLIFGIAPNQSGLIRGIVRNGIHHIIAKIEVVGIVKGQLLNVPLGIQNFFAVFLINAHIISLTASTPICRKPEEYTLDEILRLTEGSLAPVACLECGAVSCDKAADCRTLPVWTELDRRTNEYLNSVTIADLLQS